MSKSIAELRQSPRVGLPERSYDLCLASSLVSEVQSLLADLEDATIEESAQAEGDEGVARPKRMGEGGRAKKIRERLTALHAEMADHTGKLTLRGVTEGDWRLWVDAHPPREDNSRDDTIAFGICNADALLDNLEQYASEWNGDPIKSGEWAFIAANAAPGDVKAIAQLVIAMHETAVNVPKLLSSSLGIGVAEND